VALNVAVVDPPVTVTEAGTLRAALLEESVTVEPPLGAAAARVAVQSELAPETRVEGEHCRVEMVGGAGVTVTIEFAELPFTVAVSVTD
jgi:hypothetical protein